MFLCGDDGLGRCCRAEAIADQQFDTRDGILHALCPCGEHDDAEAFIAGRIPAASPGVDGHERRYVVRSSCVRAAGPSCSMRPISERVHSTTRAAAIPYGGSSA
jgi:hypothetical protein